MRPTMHLTVNRNNQIEPEFVEFDGDCINWDIEPFTEYPIVHSSLFIVYDLLRKFEKDEHMESILTSRYFTDVLDFCFELEIRRNSIERHIVSIDLFYFSEREISFEDEIIIEQIQSTDEDIIPHFYDEFSTYIEGWNCDLNQISEFDFSDINMNRKIIMERKINLHGDIVWERKSLK
jgi:hypothetical protein